MRELGKGPWDEMVSRILVYSKNVTIDEDTARMQMLLEIYYYFLAVRLPSMDDADGTEHRAYAATGSPFLFGNRIYFCISSFRRHYTMNVGKLDDSAVMKVLREVGFDRKRVAGRRWWVIDHDMMLKLVGAETSGEESKEGSDGEGKSGYDYPGSRRGTGPGRSDSPLKRSGDSEDQDGTRRRGLFPPDQLN
jgi:hypothetical protein